MKKEKPIQNNPKIIKEIMSGLFVVLGIGLAIYTILSSFEPTIPFGKIGLKIMPIAIISFVIGLALFLTSYKKKK